MIIKSARQLLILVAGTTVILIGIAGLLLPIIPGLIVIPLGLAILATEFIWAKRLLKKLKSQANGLFNRGQPKADSSQKEQP